jgi:clusterin-associated protein 1
MTLHIQTTLKQIENCKSDELNLKSKLDKKKNELARIEKRLQSIQNVRPPYMDEHDKIEKDLIQLYSEYTIKFRHLGYLEHQMALHEQQDFEHHHDIELNFKTMQNQLKEKETRLLRGYEANDDAPQSNIYSITLISFV